MIYLSRGWVATYPSTVHASYFSAAVCGAEAQLEGFSCTDVVAVASDWDGE